MKKYFIIASAILGIGIMPHLSFASTVSLTPSSEMSGSEGSLNIMYGNSEWANSNVWFYVTSNTFPYDVIASSTPNMGYNNTYYMGSGSNPWNTTWSDANINTGLASGNYIFWAFFQFRGGANSSIWENCTAMNVLPCNNAIDNLPNSVATTTLTITSPTPPSPTISFFFPTNGTTTADFSTWELTISNVTTTDEYKDVVTYTPFGGSINYIDTNLFYPDFSSGISPLNKSTLLASYAATSSWLASADLYDMSEDNKLVATSTAISFMINQNTSTYTGIYSSVGLTSPPDFTSSTALSSIMANPYSCSGTLLNFSVGNCIKSWIYDFGQILIQPSNNAQSYLNSSVKNLQGVPPFTGIFQTYNGLTGAVTAVPLSQDLNYSLTLGDGTYLNATYTVPFLNSSTMSLAITPSGKTLLFNLEDAMFDLLTLGVMFFVPWHWWNKKQNAGPKT